MKKIVISTGGGDAPGLNAVIFAVVKSAYRRGWEIYGSKSGYKGLLDPEELIRLTPEKVEDITPLGGTILGSTNKGNPFAMPVENLAGEVQIRDLSDRVMQNFKRMGFFCHIAVGGDGSLEIAHRFAVEKGMPVIGVPKTIDNDLAATDITFGFDTALVTATEALDKLHTTAMSHHRVMIMETMGRYAGWIALYSGVAGGGDVILIPEIPFQLDSICHTVQERGSRGKRFSIIVAAEGAKPEGGQMVVQRIIKESTDQLRLGGIGQQLAGQIEDRTGIECRVTVLGHLQRGGSPSAFDRILGTRFGVKAVELAAAGQFGRMVALKGLNVESVPLQEAVGSLRLVSPDSEVIKAARSVGVSFGD
jgi:6-phosphofructokinase 1